MLDYLQEQATVERKKMWKNKSVKNEKKIEIILIFLIHHTFSLCFKQIID